MSKLPASIYLCKHRMFYTNLFYVITESGGGDFSWTPWRVCLVSRCLPIYSLQASGSFPRISSRGQATFTKLDSNLHLVALHCWWGLWRRPNWVFDRTWPRTVYSVARWTKNWTLRRLDIFLRESARSQWDHLWTAICPYLCIYRAARSWPPKYDQLQGMGNVNWCPQIKYSFIGVRHLDLWN